MQFLSDIVNKKASQNIRWVIGITAIISAILIAGILIKNNTDKCENSLSLYASQLDKSMGEKVAFISTIAEGISSGAVDSTMHMLIKWLQSMTMYLQFMFAFRLMTQFGRTASQRI